MYLPIRTETGNHTMDIYPIVKMATVYATMNSWYTNANFRRYLGLVLACASITMAGTVFTSTIFALDLKNQFGLTQQSVELIASLGNLGASLGYPAGLIHENIGIAGSYIAALFLGGVAAMILYTTRYYSQVCHTYWFIFVIFWMIYGFGTSFMFLVSSAVSMNNFPMRHRGLIVGLTGAFFWAGPMLFGIIYVTGFEHAPIGDFFLCLAVFHFTSNILSICLIRSIPLEPEDADEATSLIDYHVPFATDPEEGTETFADRIGWSHFKLPAFQLLSWGFLLGTSLQIMYFANLTIYLKGYDLDQLKEVLPIAGPACSIVFTFGAGIVSDYTLKYFSRVSYLICGTALQAMAFFISIFYGDDPFVFVVTTIILYSNNGIYWSIVPALISEYFGMHHFTRDWGLELMSNAILVIGMCAMFGLFYQNAIMEVNPSTTECFGLHCFNKCYSVAGLASAASAILFSVLCFKEHRLRRTVHARRLSHSPKDYKTMD